MIQRGMLEWFSVWKDWWRGSRSTPLTASYYHPDRTNNDKTHPPNHHHPHPHPPSLPSTPRPSPHIPLNRRNHLIPHPRRILKHALKILLYPLKPLLIQSKNPTLDAFGPPPCSDGEFEIFFPEGEIVDRGVDYFGEEPGGEEEVFGDAEPETEELFMRRGRIGLVLWEIYWDRCS